MSSLSEITKMKNDDDFEKSQVAQGAGVPLAVPRNDPPASRAAETWIGDHPCDGRQYDNQCARCGSSLHWHDCDNCGGAGLSGHECGEDVCCCEDPDDNEECDWCEGEGGSWQCLSLPDYCKANPIKGRDDVAAGTPQWFVIP